MHVRLADESVCIGPAPAAKSYLNIPAIIAACEITGADAVHPGYGFLSENAKFAEIVDAHGYTFIGPKPEHIRVMGDKISAKQTVKEAGIPVVPGSDGGVSTIEEAMAAAEQIGFPVLIKAAAGGGGRGMKVAKDADSLAEAVATAQGEAEAAFGDGTGLHGALSADAAAYRAAGHRRQPRTRRASGRARLLAAAPPSEGAGGGPLTGDRRRHAREDRRGSGRGDHAHRLSGRGHHRVPLRERRVLLHRDEHPAPGRASGDRGDHRRRFGARADPRRRRPAAVVHPRPTSPSRATPSSAASMRRTRAPSPHPPDASPTSMRPEGLGCDWTRRSTPAGPSRPITTA